jgi:hypothetical protein
MHACTEVRAWSPLPYVCGEPQLRCRAEYEALAGIAERLVLSGRELERQKRPPTNPPPV